MANCPICCDTYTSQLRKPVCCPYCNESACSVCTKKYLTDGVLDAHCMMCRRAWNDEFLDLNFTRAFRIGPYKKHREHVLMEREIAILPTRQPRVEARLKVRDTEVLIRDVNKELQALEVARSKILRRSHRLTAQLTRYTAESEGRPPPAWTLTEGEKAATPERAKFIMKCPDGECRGFLSTAYKCGTCQMWACPDCLVMKGLDKDSPHTCDPGQKDSVALIIKESRPCPKCGERISKVDGCDQMFCTECHTAFSWVTGQVVNGVIHNPHYYEFLRKQGNGVAPRNAGDVPCGGVPYYRAIHLALTTVTPATQRIVLAIHRLTAEVADQRIQMYQGAFNVDDNGDLGMMYLMKEISKEAMQTELAKRELKRNKHLAIRGVLEMFVNTSTMMLNNIVNTPPADEAAFAMTLTEYDNLRTYVNESLMNVSRMKSCSVPQIGDKWEWKQFNKIGPKPKASAASAGQPPKLQRPTAAERREQAAQALVQQQEAEQERAAQAAQDAEAAEARQDQERAAQDAAIDAAIDSAATSIVNALTALRQEPSP